MQGMVNRDRIGALVFLVFSVLYGLKATTIELYFISPDEPFTPRTFPLALAWAGALVSFLILVLPRRRAPTYAMEVIRGFDWPKIVLLLLLMLGYGFAIQGVGFFLATSFFLIIGYGILGERRWWMLLVASFPVAAAFQFILHGLLGIYITDPFLQALGIVR